MPCWSLAQETMSYSNIMKTTHISCSNHLIYSRLFVSKPALTLSANQDIFLLLAITVRRMLSSLQHALSNALLGSFIFSSPHKTISLRHLNLMY
jgi:hypothetical protein